MVNDVVLLSDTVIAEFTEIEPGALGVRFVVRPTRKGVGGM